MSTQTNAVYGAVPSAPSTASGTMSSLSPLYWSVKRELWENRSVYLGPPAVAVLILVAFLIGAFRFSHMTHTPDGNSFDPLSLVEKLNGVTALVIMATAFVVAFFYCLDALYGERRDRSILFWKSLPVSDGTAVAAKAIVPIVILPLVAFATTVITQGIILTVSSAILKGHGVSPAPLWNASSLFQGSLMLLFHLVAIHGLWYAPIYGWLFLVSAWAKRAPFLWAVIPVAAVEIVEKIAFGTSYVGNLLARRMSGGGESGDIPAPGMAMDSAAHIHLGQFLIAPGLWGGLAIAAAFLAGAVYLRRSRSAL